MPKWAAKKEAAVSINWLLLIALWCRLSYPHFSDEENWGWGLNNLPGKVSNQARFMPRPGSSTPAPSRPLAMLPGGAGQGPGWARRGRVLGRFPGLFYLALLHHRLLSALGAVARHDAGAKILAVAGALLHGVGLRVVATPVGRAAALGQAELPAERTVLLLHLAHTYLQALALPLAGRSVPRAVRLGLQRGQRHRLPICGHGEMRGVKVEEINVSPTTRSEGRGNQREPHHVPGTSRLLSQFHWEGEAGGKWVINVCIQSELGTELKTEWFAMRVKN